MRFWVCFESGGSQDFLMDWCGSAAGDKQVAKVLGLVAGERIICDSGRARGRALLD